ncbi:MAG: exopolysaccharide biosynthesis polyprenyl glycosylphosphotransferase, partial [Actinomycetota bacterium]
YVLPRFFELGVAPRGADADDVWGIPLMRLSRRALRSPAWRVKRAFDVVVASVALVLTSPVFLVLGALVKLSSRGPVFFRQRRVGQRGVEVDILKFRSMRPNEESDLQWTVRDDDRVTRIGRLLRRTSLDELPQLINIVKGDMSLVGPRPERPFFVDQFGEAVPRYGDRHRVPVGLTGWAQVHGLRGDTSIEDRARFDNQYIEHWSLWKDVSILLRTAREVARGGGE